MNNTSVNENNKIIVNNRNNRNNSDWLFCYSLVDFCFFLYSVWFHSAVWWGMFQWRRPTILCEQCSWITRTFSSQSSGCQCSSHETTCSCSCSPNVYAQRFPRNSRTGSLQSSVRHWEQIHSWWFCENDTRLWPGFDMDRDNLKRKAQDISRSESEVYAFLTHNTTSLEEGNDYCRLSGM